MAEKQKPEGLERAYGEAPAGGRKVTGDPDAPPAAATDTLGNAMERQAEAREAQAERERKPDEGDPSDDDEARRKRAYAIWESEGRPEGRDQEHWHAAGEDRIPEPGTTPWTEGP